MLMIAKCWWQKIQDEEKITTFPHWSNILFIKSINDKTIPNFIEEVKHRYREFIKKWLTLMMLQEKT